MYIMRIYLYSRTDKAGRDITGEVGNRRDRAVFYNSNGEKVLPPGSYSSECILLLCERLICLGSPFIHNGFTNMWLFPYGISIGSNHTSIIHAPTSNAEAFGMITRQIKIDARTNDSSVFLCTEKICIYLI